MYIYCVNIYPSKRSIQFAPASLFEAKKVDLPSIKIYMNKHNQCYGNFDVAILHI